MSHPLLDFGPNRKQARFDSGWLIQLRYCVARLGSQSPSIVLMV
jgi:hypothetical protein